jgi:ribosomal protein L11 methyltransferase
MNYKELVFTLVSNEEYQQDLLIYALGELGFDTFEETDFGFKAYIVGAKFNQEEVELCLKPFNDQFTFSYEVNIIPQKNWNEVWESNFEPIQILDKVYVRATFHQPQPNFEYEIVIDPKMAFGTGHHQTTALILEYLLETDVKDKTILDMGCGTGILAILASKLGAKSLTAIDYDQLCFDSTLENSALNHIDNIEVICGSKEVIPQQQYDIILANINRNILLDQLERYAEVLKPGGAVFLSGFFESPDLDVLKEEALKHSLTYQQHKTIDQWAAAKFIK